MLRYVIYAHRFKSPVANMQRYFGDANMIFFKFPQDCGSEVQTCRGCRNRAPLLCVVCLITIPIFRNSA